MVFGFTKGSWVHDGFWDSQCSIDAPGFTMVSGIHNGFTICNIVAVSYTGTSRAVPCHDHVDPCRAKYFRAVP